MRLLFILASTILVQSAMAVPPQGARTPKDGLISNTDYQGLVEGIQDSGLTVVVQEMNQMDLSSVLVKKCSGGSRSGVIFAVHTVDAAGDVIRTNYFGTTELAENMKQCQ
ncbi:MAG: hypothetical protein ACAH59_14390 [Pseudobdellovibrionaceae bacterium]